KKRARRENLRARKKEPPPAPVEGRTSPIAFSCKPLLRLAYLCECRSPTQWGRIEVGVSPQTGCRRFCHCGPHPTSPTAWGRSHQRKTFPPVSVFRHSG